MWAMFEWMGPDAGVQWIHESNAESMMTVLV